jgi:hypothetical protein
VIKIGYSKIDHLILYFSKKYSFDKYAKRHISYIIEEMVKNIVIECENIASLNNYQKKRIGVEITRQVINTQKNILKSGDNQEKDIGEKHDKPGLEVA